MPSITRCIHQCKSFEGLDAVILATTKLDEDLILCEKKYSSNALVWRGEERDVLARYLGAAKEYEIDVVVRVTGDCPFVSSEIMELLLSAHKASNADYTAAHDCAVGTSCEIINVAAMEMVFDYFKSTPHSEYMTWYFRNNSHIFNVKIVSLPDELVRAYRLTLDYHQDLDMFNMLLGCIGQRRVYKIRDLFSVLDKREDIAMINAKMDLRYQVDQTLIDLLNKETKIL